MLKVATRTLLKASRPQLVSPSIKTFSRSLITLKDHKYTAHATAKGKGRNGEVKSNGLDLHLATPKELGGTGKGENPEQLFAMGYASGRMGKDASKAVVHASVHLGEPKELEGFGLAVDIKVEGVDDDVLKAGHEHGAVVKVSKA
ncbi:hypothetical protein C0993_002553 [Termitomyces sp. T159_Od127]|nr:hypothetical protein C0993_002553 [Termitomyces sp. T159_Od127]